MYVYMIIYYEDQCYTGIYNYARLHLLASDEDLMVVGNVLQSFCIPLKGKVLCQSLPILI